MFTGTLYVMEVRLPIPIDSVIFLPTFTMTAQRSSFFSHRFYHIYNRGVEKRKIFSDDVDRYRFVHNLFEFNDKKPASSLSAYYLRKELEASFKTTMRIDTKRKRKQLVTVVAFVLMPNSFQLIVEQKGKDGITTFLRKVGTGYTNYFNKKYRRIGHLFQGRFRSREVQEGKDVLTMSYIIHASPIKLIIPQWQKTNLTPKDRKKVMTFLEAYQWSSFPSYAGRKHRSGFVDKTIVQKALGKQRYRAEFMNMFFKDSSIREQFIQKNIETFF
jgi:putative transposase